MHPPAHISAQERLPLTGIRFRAGICDYSAAKTYMIEREYIVEFDPFGLARVCIAEDISRRAMIPEVLLDIPPRTIEPGGSIRIHLEK